jgi:hypothetical protein
VVNRGDRRPPRHVLACTGSVTIAPARPTLPSEVVDALKSLAAF